MKKMQQVFFQKKTRKLQLLCSFLFLKVLLDKSFPKDILNRQCYIYCKTKNDKNDFKKDDTVTYVVKPNGSRRNEITFQKGAFSTQHQRMEKIQLKDLKLLIRNEPKFFN